MAVVHFVLSSNGTCPLTKTCTIAVESDSIQIFVLPCCAASARPSTAAWHSAMKLLLGLTALLRPPFTRPL
ncbi:hypothetical protein FRX31_008368 [Thalictrum thalictroides]|uniref:Uncharacterized protein n=1 Tax=Thalictrum thalictroides TaxID=46969 RepID=A0A7J6WZN9_THATH|nr:hypothetical protein FRX31_008368 [Thalictrum thalictroides]